MTDDIHSCSYYCDRIECVKRQRDELREKLEAIMAERDELRRRIMELGQEGYELLGVIEDVERKDGGFDEVCLRTVKRVQSKLAHARVRLKDDEL